MADLLLKVRGGAFGGWEAVRLQRSIEAVAGVFELVVSDRRPWPIFPGDPCEIEIDGEPVLAGWVDLIQGSIWEDGHRVTIVGRDATGDLVDCSPLVDPGEWINTRLLRIATDIAAPIGVSVVGSSEDEGEPFSNFALQPGESAWEALERLCRLRGLLAMPTATGQVLIAPPSEERASAGLELGRNIVAATATLDLSERFGRYRVRGQHSAIEGSDDQAIASTFGEARDLGVRSTRMLEIIAEGAVTDQLSADRAAWEATWRVARSVRITVRTAGWRQRGDSGPLWAMNRIVGLRAPELGVIGDFLIAGATYVLDEGGSTTELELARRDAFRPSPTLAAEEDAVWRVETEE